MDGKFAGELRRARGGCGIRPGDRCEPAERGERAHAVATRPVGGDETLEGRDLVCVIVGVVGERQRLLDERHGAAEVDDTVALTARLVEAGAELIAEPRETPWRSVNSRLRGPAALQLTLFEELD